MNEMSKYFVHTHRASGNERPSVYEMQVYEMCSFIDILIQKYIWNCEIAIILNLVYINIEKIICSRCGVGR